MREHGIAHRRLQGAAGIFYRHPTCEPLCGRQSDAAHGMRIAQRQNLDNDLLLGPRTQQGVNGRQMFGKPDIHDAAAHGDNDAKVPPFGHASCMFFCRASFDPVHWMMPIRSTGHFTSNTATAVPEMSFETVS